MKSYLTLLFLALFTFTTQAQIELPELPYSTDAFTNVIDQKTMEIHYGKHHQGYTNNLNKAIEKEKASGLDIQRILNKISSYSTAMRNNAGGYYNHDLFWNILTPEKTTPNQALAQAIEKEFDSMDNLKEQMNKETAGQFGSGWGWLIVTESGDLKIVTTPNQDNPLMDVVPIEDQGTPILGIDVWEHAYYLKYQNKRAEYLNNIWDIINWEKVGELYKLALKS